MLAVNLSRMGLPTLEDYVAGVKFVMENERVARAHFFGFGFGGVVCATVFFYVMCMS